MNYFNQYAIKNNKQHPIAELFSDAIKKCEMLPASVQCTETVIAIQKCKDAVGELISTLTLTESVRQVDTELGAPPTSPSGVPIHVEQPIINQISINGEFIDPTKCSEKHHYCAKRTSGICDNPNGCIFDKYSTGTTFTPSKPWNPPQPTTNEYEHVVKPEKTQSIHESPILAESISERASILVKEFNSIFTGEKYSEALALFCIRKIAELQLELELKRLLNI